MAWALRSTLFRSCWFCCWPHLVLLRTLVSVTATTRDTFPSFTSCALQLCFPSHWEAIFPKIPIEVWLLQHDTFPSPTCCRLQPSHLGATYFQSSWCWGWPHLVYITWRLLQFPCHSMRCIWNKMLSPLHCICVISFAYVFSIEASCKKSSNLFGEALFFTN